MDKPASQVGFCRAIDQVARSFCRLDALSNLLNPMERTSLHGKTRELSFVHQTSQKQLNKGTMFLFWPPSDDVGNQIMHQKHECRRGRLEQ